MSSLLRGRAPFASYLEAWHLAWPLILSNLTVPLLGMVDTAVVGHLPDPHHLGAVALGATTFSALFFTVISLKMGTTGLIAQAYGAGAYGEVEAGLRRALILALAIAVLLLFLTWPIIDLAHVVFAPSEAVGEGLEAYLSIRFLSAPAALANMVVLGWLLGVQDARSPLLLLALGNGLNILLDLLFVFGLGMEVAGVAAATVIAEYATLLLGAFLIQRHRRKMAIERGVTALFDIEALARLLAVNGDIVVRSLCLQAAFVALAALGSRQSELILAANTVLLTMLHLAAHGLDGFAHAASTLVGRYAGARDDQGLRRAIVAGFHWSLVFAAVITLIYGLGGGAVVALLTNQEPVRALAGEYLIYMIFLPPIAATAFLFDGVYIGVTRTAAMRNGMIAALVMFALCVLLLVPTFANHGLWLSFLIFMGARGVGLGWFYLHLKAKGGFMPSAPVRRPLQDHEAGS